MAKNKTTETSKSVPSFIKAVKDETRRKDSHQIIEWMTALTGHEPKMWGPSIIGFGSYHYIYESGREGDMPLIAFSPRSTTLVFYFSGNFDKRDELLQQLGKHKTEKGCVYVKRLEDIDVAVLKKMMAGSIKHRKKLYAKPSKA